MYSQICKVLSLQTLLHLDHDRPTFEHHFCCIFQSRLRLVQKKEELEDILHDMELRMEEEEEKVAAMLDERKKYNQTIQDLEEQ